MQGTDAPEFDPNEGIPSDEEEDLIPVAQPSEEEEEEEEEPYTYHEIQQLSWPHEMQQRENAGSFRYDDPRYFLWKITSNFFDYVINIFYFYFYIFLQYYQLSTDRAFLKGTGRIRSQTHGKVPLACKQK